MDRSTWSTSVRPRRSRSDGWAPSWRVKKTLRYSRCPRRTTTSDGLEAAGALLQDEGREDGLDDEVHVAADEALRQVVEVPRDDEVTHPHVA